MAMAEAVVSTAGGRLRPSPLATGTGRAALMPRCWAPLPQPGSPYRPPVDGHHDLDPLWTGSAGMTDTAAIIRPPGPAPPSQGRTPAAERPLVKFVAVTSVSDGRGRCVWGKRCARSAFRTHSKRPEGRRPDRERKTSP
jgi:hypothetical protein